MMVWVGGMGIRTEGGKGIHLDTHGRLGSLGAWMEGVGVT